MQICYSWDGPSAHAFDENPHAPVDAISAILNSKMEAIFCKDFQQKTALDYAIEYNSDGLVATMQGGLCNQRNSSRSAKVGTNYENATKKRRIELG